MKRILVACEYSGRVRDEFAAEAGMLGHAISSQAIRRVSITKVMCVIC